MSPFRRGYEDAFNGRPYRDPYDEGSAESDEYFRGYCAGEDVASSI